MRAYKIAITGGIGSGKTTVSQLLINKGYTVYDADAAANQVMQTPEIKKQVIESFGLSADKDGNYQRSELAEKIFNDRNKLELLNAIVHPPTMQEIISSMEKISGIVFAEIPLLFESGTEKLFDHVLIVKRKDEQRISSVMVRSNLSRAQVEQRIKNQHNYEIKPEIEHTVIYNDSDLFSLNNKLEEFLGEITKKAH